VRIPLFSWPLPREKAANNPIVETEARMCRECLFGFNSKPLTPEHAALMYGDYVYIKPTKGFGSSVHEGFIELIGHCVPKDAKILEIGSSDGYLLSRLQKNGYLYLAGMDQNPRAPEEFDIPIKKEVFSKDTVIDEPVDVLLMQNMFQYFAKPWEILNSAYSTLPRGGRLLVEATLYTSGIHHQHMSFMTIPFFLRIAEKSGFGVKKIESLGGIYRAVLVKGEKCEPVFNERELGEERDKVLGRIAEFEKDERKRRERLNNFVSETHESPIYWYGTGLAAHMLSGLLERDVAEGREFFVVDGDSDRKGLIYTPTGTTVHWAGECLADKKIGSIVLATSFGGEVNAYLDKLNCRAERTFFM
jgi:SAM-dependent methyltransferase